MIATSNNTIAKFAAVLAGLALVGSSFAAFAPAASAQSNDDLQAQINALLAQIAALQGNTGTTAAVTFSMDLTLGSTGSDVTALQNWLISKGHSIPAGATGYFGAQTQSALAAYQAANGISPAAGYFGPITRAHVNAQTSVGGGTGTGTGTGSDNDNDNDNDGDLEGDAGDLESADFVSGLNNEEVGEGDEMEVAGLELEADDNSDLRVLAVRVSFEYGPDAPNGTSDEGSEDFDDYAESISLWFDGEEVASEDVDDIDEDDGVWETTLSLDEDAIIRAEESMDLVVAVTAHDNIDEDDLEDNNWEVTFESVRYEDAQGAVITEDGLDDIGEAREFEFSTFASANEVELTIDESDETPDEGTTEVDEDGGDEMLLLVGEAEAEGADIEVTEMTVSISAENATTTMAVQDAASEFILMHGDNELDSVDSDEGTGTSTDSTREYTFNIDDEEFMVGEGDTEEFWIWAVIEEVEDGEVVRLTASVDAEDIEAEAEGEDLEESEDEINGTAQGDEQTFRSEGLAVTFSEEDSDTQEGNNNTEFIFELDIEAFGDDVDLTVGDFDFTVSRSSGTTTAVTSAEELESDDFEDNGGTTVEVDESEGRVTYTVTLFADAASDNDVYTVTLTTVEDTVVNESLTDALTFQS